MDKEIDRYLDFSTDEIDVEAFRAAVSTHPQLVQCAEEIQRYMRSNNPICAIRGLIGFQTATSMGFYIGVNKSRAITNVLLSFIASLLLYISYQLS